MEETFNGGEMIGSKMSGLEAMFAPIFAKAPHLPENGRKIIRDFAPWIALIFGALSLFSLFSAGIITLIFSPLLILSSGFQGIVLFVTILLGIVVAVLSLLAFSPLREMKKKGWNYLFYGMVVNLVSVLVSFLGLAFNLGGIVGVLIGMYILFEVRESYN